MSGFDFIEAKIAECTCFVVRELPSWSVKITIALVKLAPFAVKTLPEIETFAADGAKAICSGKTCVSWLADCGARFVSENGLLSLILIETLNCPPIEGLPKIVTLSAVVMKFNPFGKPETVKL